jgi:L-2-hydroxyglutarate oxidase LhgO
MRKSTNKELVAEMEAINVDGKLDEFIRKAKLFFYHDYKQPGDIVCGKMLFATESYGVPELADLRERLINGEFDEEADEEDKADMRKDMPAHMWKAFGLEPLN